MQNVKAQYRTLYSRYFPILFILVSGFFIRYFFWKSIDGTLTTSDTPTYIDGAMSLYHHFYLNEYRPPVYPLGLMLTGILFSWEKLSTHIVLLQLLVSAMNTIFTYKLVNEAFGSRLLAFLTTFLISVSIRIYCWDFVMLSENFSILLVTWITYALVLYVKYGHKKYIRTTFLLTLLAIFTKPFFLLLPFAVLLIIAVKALRAKDFTFRPHIRTIAAGFAAVYACVVLYSAVNYAQNVYFGLTTVGNVNYFGKILQYQMEDLGNNPRLVEDIQYAFSTEKDEYKVDNRFLEPWHFVTCYGWSKDHYQDVGKFAMQIIRRHPLEYIAKSLRLTRDLLVRSPFQHYMAETALAQAGHPSRIMLAAKKFSEIFESLYLLIIPALLEGLYLLFFSRKKAAAKESLPLLVILCMLLYHYVISAFFSYGDYCRLLVPGHTLIFIVLCLYSYRFASYVSLLAKNIFKSRLKAGR